MSTSAAEVVVAGHACLDIIPEFRRAVSGPGGLLAPGGMTELGPAVAAYDADLSAAQKDAQGQLLVKRAEAEGERLRNLAMMGAGGNILVALEAARNLNLSKATISTINVDLLDLDTMAEKLGVPKRKGGK